MKFKEKYDRLSPAFRATFWFIICGFIQKAIVSLTTPVFTRLMSVEQYGEYSIYNSWLNILVIVVTLNINGVIATKGLSKYNEDGRRFLSVLQFISCSSVLFFFLFYLGNMELFNNLIGFPTYIMFFMFLQMLLAPAFEIWSAGEKYEYRYKSLLNFTILFVVLSTTVGIWAVFTAQDKGKARIVSFAVIQSIFYFCLLLSNWKKGKKIWNREYWKFTLRFNIPLIPHGLSNQILARSDIFMINYFAGMAETGIYSLGYSVATILTVFTVSINNVFVPWLFQKLETDNYCEIEKVSKLILMISMTVVTGIILCAPELVGIFAAKEYEMAIYIIPPVAVGIYFTMVYTLFINIEIYYEKTKLVMVGSIMVAILNVVLNFILIPKFGFLAAAYTTTISYMIYSIVHYFCVSHLCQSNINIKDVYNIKFIVLLSCIQIAVMLVIQSLYSRNTIRYCLCLFMLVVIWVNRRKIFENISTMLVLDKKK